MRRRVSLYRITKKEDPYFGPGSFWAERAEDAVGMFPGQRVPKGRKVYLRYFYPDPRQVMRFESEIDYDDYLQSLGFDMGFDTLGDEPVRAAFRERESGLRWVRKPVELPSGAWTFEWVRLNPPGPEGHLRELERIFFTDDTPENWARLLIESRKYGKPRFTAEGMRLACEARTAEIIDRNDEGLTARVTHATLPAGVRHRIEHASHPYDPGEILSDVVPYDGPWNGLVRVAWNRFNEFPSLEFKTDREPETFWYWPSAVTDDESMGHAFRDEAGWEDMIEEDWCP